ncbi:MAG: leucine-rich repeat protein [Enterocloster sp.]
MKKKKLLSYILTTSLLISLTANPVLSMAEETNLSQEITVDQDNHDQDSKSQNISSEKNADSKDKNENDGSDRGDEIEPSEDGKTEDLQEDEDKANLSSGKDEKPDLNGSDGDQSEESKKDSINDSSEEDSDQADADYGRLDEDENIDPDFSQPVENPEESSSAAGTTANSGSTSGGSGTSKKNDADLDECEHLEGCVDGKHDPECPLYEGEVELPSEAECAHLEGCVGELHDKDCPLYKELNAALSAKLPLAVQENIYEDVYITVDGVEYRFDFYPDTHEATLTRITNPNATTDVEIPEKVSYHNENESDDEEYTVTELSLSFWAPTCKNVTKLNIPDTVETCNSYFRCFSNLEEITIPGSVKTFSGSFQSMNHLKTITFEEGVEELAGNSLLSNCAVETIHLPDSLKRITAPSAFSGASKLKTIELPEGIDIREGSLFAKDSSLVSITLPASITKINDSMFKDCSSLETVTAEGTITEVGQEAFKNNTKLTNIPDLSQVTSMGTFAFSECNNLKGEVNLASLNDIPYRAFLNTPIESVVLSDSLQKINDEAFSGTKIASITFPESLTAIGSKSFANTLLNQDTLIIPDNVATIGSSAFSGATIKKLVLGSGLTNTSNNEFAGIDGLESVTVQNSSDVLNLSNAGLPQNVTINYTIPSISDTVGDTISSEAGAPSLQEAVDTAADGETIKIKKDIKLSSQVTIPQGKSITITSDDDYTIVGVKDGTKPENLFEVLEGANVIFAGKLILSGRYNDKSIIKNHGTVTITDDVTVRDATIKYDETGALENSRTNAKLVISGGQITNNKIINHAEYSATVLIKDGAAFEMTGGSIQDNNSVNANYSHSTGGVFFFGASKGEMSGGRIQRNIGHRGSVVVLSNGRGADQQAAFTLSGDGLITENSGTSGNNVDAGGAVFIENNAVFEMTGGKITNNHFIQGGGVCVVDDGVQDSTIEEYGTAFVMNGGTISGNHASHGGGIYSFSNGTVLNSGKIVNNTAGVSGGGIYSEGRRNNVYSSMHLYNAIVTNNTAQQGGGLWFCATGTTTLNIKDGIGIFENKAVESDDKAAGDDLVFSVFGNGDPDYTATLSSRMLGGGAIQWYPDGKIYNGVTSSYPSVISDIRYNKDDPTSTALESGKLADIQTSQALKTIMSADAQDLAENEAQLFIEGNTAKYGGGIGANGGIIVGEDDTIDISVKKVWNNAPASGTPDSVTVRLINEEHVIDWAVLNAANNWEYQFEDLPEGYSYSVSEVVPADYTPTVSGNQTEGFQILNTYTPGTPAEPEKPDNGGTNPGNSNHGSGGSGSSGSGSSGGSGSSTRTAQVVETTPVEPVKEDIQPVPEDIQHEDFASEANIALPKTGQAPNQSALVFFSSALLLLVTLIFKKKED